MTDTPVVDLWQDIVSGCRMDLVHRGHGVAGLDDWRCVWTFLNAERRSIPAQPRRVYRSKQFQCPPAHMQALAEIEAKMEQGVDLAPH